MKRANLTGTDLSYSNLIDADLRGSNSADADMTGAKLPLDLAPAAAASVA
jgi:uncharacterized protein YjbI with pentapeptide repeats